MKHLLISFLLLCPQLLFAGGGSEDISVLLNGWTVRFSSADGSSAFLDRGKDHGNIIYKDFWELWLILQTLPANKGSNDKFLKTEQSFSDGTPPKIIYYDSSQTRAIIELIILTHRNKIQSDEPSALETALSLQPLLSPQVLSNRNFAFHISPLDTKTEQGAAANP